MRAAYSDARIHIILLGSRRDELLQQAAALLARYCLPFELSDDIYDSVARIACCRDDCEVVVIARHELLAGEKGYLIRKARRKALTCCCIYSHAFHNCFIREQLLSGSGIFYVQTPEEIAEVIHKRLAFVTADSISGDAGRRGDDLITEGFRASQEEIDALLGASSDDKG